MRPGTLVPRNRPTTTRSADAFRRAPGKVSPVHVYGVRRDESLGYRRIGWREMHQAMLDQVYWIRRNESLGNRRIGWREMHQATQLTHWANGIYRKPIATSITVLTRAKWS